jgi:hypothetical protein
MGVAYSLDKTLALTLTVFDGPVTGDEWRSTVRDLFADPSWPPGRLNLTDLRSADLSAITASDRAAVHAINARHAHKLVGMKSAAIGGANFEAARSFERDDRSSGLRIIPFDDLGPACVWLSVDAHAIRPMIEQLRHRLREPVGSQPADARWVARDSNPEPAD